MSNFVFKPETRNQNIFVINKNVYYDKYIYRVHKFLNGLDDDITVNEGLNDDERSGRPRTTPVLQKWLKKRVKNLQKNANVSLLDY